MALERKIGCDMSSVGELRETYCRPWVAVSGLLKSIEVQWRDARPVGVEI